MVRLFRGPAKSFDKVAHKDGLYFAIDRGEIYLNDSVYGSEYTVTDIKMNEDGSSLVVSFREHEDKTISLADLGKIKGVAEGDKFLSLDEATGKLGVSVALEYHVDVTGETPVYEIRLTGKNGEVVSTIDAKEFVKDGMLNKAELVENPEGQAEGVYLVLTWNTESGLSEPMYVPVNDLIKAYHAGNGISIVDNNIAVVVKEGDPYLEVTANGVATKGIDDAISAAKIEVLGTENDDETAVTVYGTRKYAESLVATLEEKVDNKVDSSVYAEFVQATNNAISAIKVTDINPEASNGVKLTKTEGGVIGVSVDAAEMRTALIGGAGEVGPLSGTTIKLGASITDGDPDNPTEIVSPTTSVQDAIQILAGQIQSAVAGGITAIDGGEYITVGGTATAKTLSLNVAKIGAYMVDNTSALKVDESGKISLEWEDVEY